MKVEDLFIKWAYNNTYKNFLKENKDKIIQLNMSSLNTLNNVAVFIFGILCLYSKLTNDYAGLFGAYLFYFIIFIVINILCKHIMYFECIISDYFLYFVIALIYAFGIYIGCFNKLNIASVMFPVFLICLPMIFILPTIEINIFNLIFIAIFLFYSMQYKSDTVLFIDQANILACFFISAVTSYTINCSRMKEISSSQKLEMVCNTDELTSLHNRRSFNQYIIKIFDKTPANRLTLMMIDIDNFKDYNDCYGHLCGDNCLVTIGEIFKKFESNHDCYIARYGGEEFVLVDTKHTLQETVTIAKELIHIISEANIEHLKSSYKKITLSIGISCKATSNVTSYIDLINLADDALYQAKSNGKNTYMIATHSASSMKLID